ncbi:aldo/keto reductase [Pseudonocardia aurantiaca]|uniref:Aldo/keto reductase n=1 Tax=Pseudonocardia aurantiaca TaxID=75290 RepID=A0ABW4FWY9_9PSEU
MRSLGNLGGHGRRRHRRLDGRTALCEVAHSFQTRPLCQGRSRTRRASSARCRRRGGSPGGSAGSRPASREIATRRRGSSSTCGKAPPGRPHRLTKPAAVALAWLRTRPGTVVPIVGARRLGHLEQNLAGIDVALSAEHVRTLDELSAPTLDYPAPMHGALRAMLQFAGTIVDGESSAVYPPLTASSVRY